MQVLIIASDIWGFVVYTSLSNINGLICLRSARMMVDLENLDSVAPNEEHKIVRAISKCIIVVVF